MKQTYFFMGGLFLSLLIISYPAQAQSNQPVPSSTKSIDRNLNNALQQVISSDLQTQGIKPEDQKLFADYIDLNGDGNQDAIVILTGSYWCGTGGCTMMVFEGRDQTFRLVSRSTLIRPPVTVSETRTNGWRDLIVDVSGGGMPLTTVALKFDGKEYPLNPSIQAPLPSNIPIKGVVLFPEGTEPQVMGQSAIEPSFDCTKAQGQVETLICKDNELAALDQQLHSVYQTALKKAEQFPPQDLADFKTEQIDWIKDRNNCSKVQGTTVRDCVKGYYRDRIAELQADFALVSAQKPVFFSCNNNPANEIVATFYETDPPTARLERGDTVITAFLRPSASGAKYEGENMIFWTKGKEATVEWKGETLQCQVR